jgi:hypothetical protein
MLLVHYSSTTCPLLVRGLQRRPQRRGGICLWFDACPAALSAITALLSVVSTLCTTTVG